MPATATPLKPEQPVGASRTLPLSRARKHGSSSSSLPEHSHAASFQQQPQTLHQMGGSGENRGEIEMNGAGKEKAKGEEKCREAIESERGAEIEEGAHIGKDSLGIGNNDRATPGSGTTNSSGSADFTQNPSSASYGTGAYGEGDTAPNETGKTEDTARTYKMEYAEKEKEKNREATIEGDLEQRRTRERLEWGIDPSPGADRLAGSPEVLGVPASRNIPKEKGASLLPGLKKKGDVPSCHESDAQMNTQRTTGESRMRRDKSTSSVSVSRAAERIRQVFSEGSASFGQGTLSDLEQTPRSELVGTQAVGCFEDKNATSERDPGGAVTDCTAPIRNSSGFKSRRSWARMMKEVEDGMNKIRGKRNEFKEKEDLAGDEQGRQEDAEVKGAGGNAPASIEGREPQEFSAEQEICSDDGHDPSGAEKRKPFVEEAKTIRDKEKEGELADILNGKPAGFAPPGFEGDSGRFLREAPAENARFAAWRAAEEVHPRKIGMIGRLGEYANFRELQNYRDLGDVGESEELVEIGEMGDETNIFDEFAATRDKEVYHISPSLPDSSERQSREPTGTGSANWRTERHSFGLGSRREGLLRPEDAFREMELEEGHRIRAEQPSLRHQADWEHRPPEKGELVIPAYRALEESANASVRKMQKFQELSDALAQRYASVEELESVIRDLIGFVVLVHDQEERRQRKGILIRSRLINNFIGALSRYPMVERIQKKGFAVIAELVREDSDMQRAFGEADAISMITESMMEHVDCVMLVESGLSALNSMVYDQENRERVSSSTIDATVTAMHQHSQMASIQSIGCLFIANCSYEHEGNQLACVHRSAIEAIVEAMRKHPLNKMVQRRGCVALRNISWGDNTIKERVVEKDGLAVVTEAISKHIEELSVVEQGCLALHNMIVRTPSHMAKFLSSRSSIAAVLGAMDCHMDAETVQDHLLDILREASTVNGAAEKFVLAGGVKVVVDVLTKNVTKRNILGKGCGVLRILAKTDNGKKALKICGGADLVLDFLYMSISSAGSADASQR